MKLSFLEKKSIGINIEDDSIEIVQLDKVAGKVILVNKDQVNLEAGVIDRGAIKNKEALSKIINDLAKKNKIDFKSSIQFIIGLPEDQIFTNIINTPKNKQNQYIVEMFDDILSSVPIEKKDIVSTYIPLREDEQNIEMLSLAMDKNILKSWQDFFIELGVDNPQIGSGILGAFNSLDLSKEELPVLVCNIDLSTMSLGVFDEEGLKFSYVSNDGVEKNDLKIISDNVKKVIDYVTDKNITIHKIVLFGVNDKLSEIKTALSKQFKIDISEANSPFIKNKEGLIFIEATGLALVGVSGNGKSKFPVFRNEIQDVFGVDIISKKEIDIDQKNKDQDEAMKAIQRNKEMTSLHKQKIALIVILIVGAIAISFAFFYQSNVQAQRIAEVKSLINNFNLTQSFNVSIPIAIVKEEQTEDRIPGELVVDKFETQGGESEAINSSRLKISKTLTNTQELWKDPINVLEEKGVKVGKDTFNRYTITWMSYNKTIANKLLESKISDQLDNIGVKYALNNIIKENIEKTDNSNLFLLNGIVTMALYKNVDLGLK